MKRRPRNEYWRDDPGNIVVRNVNGSGFELVFEGRTASGGKKLATFKLDSWWVQFLARELWKVPKAQREALDSNERALRGQP